MSDRRRIRLLRNLIATTSGRSTHALEQAFGTHVQKLISVLYVANHVEYDGRGFVRLTLAGRNEARRILALNGAAAA